MDNDDSHDLATAFGDLADRADPRDRIFLRDHVRAVEIGAFQEERGTRQRLRFDIVVEVAANPDAALHDDVDSILSYDTLIDAIDAEFAIGRLNLLEALADRIATRVLTHAQAKRAFIRIQKLDRGPHTLGVEIVRSADGAAGADQEGIADLRVVVRQVDAPDLFGWLDAMAGHGPTIIVAAPAGDGVRTGHPATQRRVDLLASEVAGWQLAGRDPRCVVVDSRTELIHLLRSTGLAVWAPSRLVLDAAVPPRDVDPQSLAIWLADNLGAG